jgi:hypothetical protein
MLFHMNIRGDRKIARGSHVTLDAIRSERAPVREVIEVRELLLAVEGSQALLAWRKQLPASLPEGQVRAALQSIHQATWAHSSNFSAKGFLTLGFAGHQPGIADVYSNSGSMYIATESFLALGLPENDSYWTSPAQEWTQQKAYSQKPFPRDGYVSY